MAYASRAHIQAAAVSLSSTTRTWLGVGLGRSVAYLRNSSGCRTGGIASTGALASSTDVIEAMRRRGAPDKEARREAIDAQQALHNVWTSRGARNFQ